MYIMTISKFARLNYPDCKKILLDARGGINSTFITVVSPLKIFVNHGSFILIFRLPVAGEMLRPGKLRRRQMRRNTLVSGLSPVAVYAAQARRSQEEPSTRVDIVFRHILAISVHLGEFALSPRQPLFGGSQQPLHGLSSVAFDGISIVIESTVVEDSKIELRGGVAAFGGEKKVLYRAALH